MARRRSQIHAPPKVPLSESELVQARMLSRWAIRLAVRQEAQDLLENGATPDHLHDLRLSCTASLCGPDAAWRWGVTSLHAIDLARRRVRQAGLIDGALYLAVLYDTHRSAPPPIFLGGGSGLGSSGLAWPCSSMVDPSIVVRRYPEPEQMVLWDSDLTPWTYWSEVRASELK